MLAAVYHLYNSRYGAPEGTRTPDTRLRRPVLCPAELQAHIESPGWITPLYRLLPRAGLNGRDGGTRTHGLLRPRQALFQLRYVPIGGGNEGT